MSELLQFCFAGLTIGAAYALVAVGFSIVYRGTGAINFVQGEYVMFAGVAAGALQELFKLPLWATLLAVVAIAIVMGLLTDLVCVRLVRARNGDAITIATIGLAVTLKAATMIASGKRTFSLPPFTAAPPIRVIDAALLPQTLWNLAIVAVAAVAFGLFFRYTRRGVMLRAAADDRIAAAMMGLSPGVATRWSFVLAALLGSVAGASLAPVTLMSFDSGTLLGLKGFAAAMLGGIGNTYGAFLGGLVLGLAEALTAGYVSSQYADVVGFVVLLLVLFARPSGLFGAAAARRV